MSQPAASPPLSGSAAQRSAAPRQGDPTGPGETAEPVAVPRRGHFDGLLCFRGSACVLGTLTGRVDARGLLRIGPEALVEADIATDELIIEGFLRGDVRARTRIELGPRARVEGRLDAPRVEFHDGCRFSGRCRSGERTQLP